MRSSSDADICLNDAVQAAGVLCAAIAGLGLVWALIGVRPGFVLPTLAAVVAALIEVGGRCRQKSMKLGDLAKFSPTFTATAKGAVIFAFLMPALFPSYAYQSSPWLIWINATFFLGGLLAIPFAKLLLQLAVRVALRRARR